MVTFFSYFYHFQVLCSLSCDCTMMGFPWAIACDCESYLWPDFCTVLSSSSILSWCSLLALTASFNATKTKIFFIYFLIWLTKYWWLCTMPFEIYCRYMLPVSLSLHPWPLCRTLAVPLSSTCLLCDIPDPSHFPVEPVFWKDASSKNLIT